MDVKSWKELKEYEKKKQKRRGKVEQFLESMRPLLVEAIKEGESDEEIVKTLVKFVAYKSAERRALKKQGKPIPEELQGIPYVLHRKKVKEFLKEIRKELGEVKEVKRQRKVEKKQERKEERAEEKRSSSILDREPERFL